MLVVAVDEVDAGDAASARRASKLRASLGLMPARLRHTSISSFVSHSSFHNYKISIQSMTVIKSTYVVDWKISQSRVSIKAASSDRRRDHSLRVTTTTTAPTDTRK